MDYLLFATLGFYMLRGWRKGGYFVLLSLIETAVCLSCALLFADGLLNLFNKFGFERFCEKLVDKLTNKINFADHISSQVGQIASKVAHISTFLVTYLLTKIGVAFAKKIFKLNKRSCEGAANSVLGVLVGILKGCCVFFVVYCTLNVAAIVSTSEKLAEFVSNAKFSNGLLSIFEEKIISVFLFH